MKVAKHGTWNPPYIGSEAGLRTGYSLPPGSRAEACTHSTVIACAKAYNEVVCESNRLPGPGLI
jgi:hypothetical protein